MNLPQTAWQISVLADSAKALAKQGNWKDATEIYERVLDAAPYHVQALNFLAARAMESDDAERSITLLERSIQAEPARARTHMNLGVALMHRGEFDAADNAFKEALRLKPSMVIADLYRGLLLEKRGLADQALAVFKYAWRRAPVLQRQLHDTSLPFTLRELLQHVSTQIQTALATQCQRVLEEIKSTYPGENFSRVEEFIAICVGSKPRMYADAAQQPSYMYFPGLEPTPFYDPNKFGWLRQLEAATAQIRNELERVLANPDSMLPYVQIDSAPDTGEWNELNHSLQWSAYHLYKNGNPVAANCERCPITTEQLGKLPLVDIAGHAPEAFFSILKPNTQIPPHFGLANYKLAVHLPLIVPPDCGIRVGHRTETWTIGQCLVFDDSFRHEAWNKSSQLRAVLIFEIWNPQLSTAEIAAISKLVVVMRDFDTI